MQKKLDRKALKRMRNLVEQITLAFQPHIPTVKDLSNPYFELIMRFTSPPSLRGLLSPNLPLFLLNSIPIPYIVVSFSEDLFLFCGGSKRKVRAEDIHPYLASKALFIRLYRKNFVLSVEGAGITLALLDEYSPERAFGFLLAYWGKEFVSKWDSKEEFIEAMDRIGVTTYREALSYLFASSDTKLCVKCGVPLSISGFSDIYCSKQCYDAMRMKAKRAGIGIGGMQRIKRKYLELLEEHEPKKAREEFYKAFSSLKTRKYTRRKH